MTIDERMRKCQARLAGSMERLDRAFGTMDTAYRSLAGESRKFADTTAALGQVIDRLEANLQRYDDELTRVDLGVRELGGKSRQLASIMDDYLSGGTLRRSPRAA